MKGGNAKKKKRRELAAELIVKRKGRDLNKNFPILSVLVLFYLCCLWNMVLLLSQIALMYEMSKSSKDNRVTRETI